jgi:pilus assembly protein Flp/PilA
MFKVLKLFDQVCKDEEGAPMIEYALLISLVALVAGVALFTLGTTVSSSFANVNSCLSTLNSASAC